jgi:hypothetical protein
MTDLHNAKAPLDALNAWAAALPRGLRSGGGVGGQYDLIQFYWRPEPSGPEAYVALHADLDDGRPVIRVDLSVAPTPRSSTPDIALLGPGSGDEETTLSGREPAARCESCGIAGTVGRAVRTDSAGTPMEIHRFCAGCWPEQSARYRARWIEENRVRSERFLRGVDPSLSGDGPGMYFEAATWHSVLELVRELEQALRAPMIPSAHVLKEMAAEIRRAAPELDGDMPFEVEAFLQRYEAGAG